MLTTLLVQLAVILAATSACGAAARRLGQTRVVGEIVAGLLLGPSVLGGVSGRLFPAPSIPTLQRLSDLGVIVFMFVVGLNLDLEGVQRKLRTAVAVSHFSIVVPFASAALFSIAFLSQDRTAHATTLALALFMGTAMSITAFPVLARIVDESSLRGTSLGSMALACAAVDDITAWLLLAVVVTVVTSGAVWPVLVRMFVELTVFVAAMKYAVRPAIAFATRRASAESDAGLLAVIVALLAACSTEMIGLHALFGAFVAGATWPMDALRRKAIANRLNASVVTLFLPLFFAVTGLRTRVGLLNTRSQWTLCLAIVGVATAGKLGGSAIAARATGFDWRDALRLGALMNARGLMELVALNIGYDLQVISPRLFTMMVLMALSTTMMAAPLVRRLGPEKPLAHSHAA